MCGLIPAAGSMSLMLLSILIEQSERKYFVG